MCVSNLRRELTAGKVYEVRAVYSVFNIPGQIISITDDNEVPRAYYADLFITPSKPVSNLRYTQASQVIDLLTI